MAGPFGAFTVLEDAQFRPLSAQQSKAASPRRLRVQGAALAVRGAQDEIHEVCVDV